MTSANDLLPLKEIIEPKAQRPNLVENVQDALLDPARTVRDYLFTPAIRGYFDRIFQDVKDGRGGGYWVQAEYGGGKTHFLSTLLCLLSEAGDEIEERVWASVTDPDLRSEWERAIRPRKLLGAHISLMGAVAVVGTRQPRLVDLIDRAVIDALARHGMNDPGIGAGAEVLRTFEDLAPNIRAIVEAEFNKRHGMSVDDFRREMGDLRAAHALLDSVPRGIKIDVDITARDHFIHVLERLKSLGFDGLVIVIDEYFSRQQVLSEDQSGEDGTLLETIGYTLGRQAGQPLYLVVASQGEMPAKLAERIDPMVLLRDEDKEYSQIVCKRIMDYRATLPEQSVLYHAYYSRNFNFLRKTPESDAREIFPFQVAVFRYLRNLVSSSRLNLPSTRFAIGAAYDAITADGVLDNRRYLTTSDLMAGKLETELLDAAELREAATALRQARDFIEQSEWKVASFQPMAHRILNHLFLDAVIGGQGQNIDQIVEGTLVEDPNGMLLAKQIAQAILRQLSGCEQIELRGDNWRFASRVTEGEQFETIFQKYRKEVHKTDDRIKQKWTELLTAPVALTAGVPTFLSAIVSPMRIPTEYCGVEYAGRAVYAPAGLGKLLDPLERLTQPDRVRVVVVPNPLPSAPNMTDPAIAVVAPGPLSESAVDEIRGLIACHEILDDYRARAESGVEKIIAAAEAKSRELTRSIVQRAKDAYREGEIYTKDGLALNAKQLFKEGLPAGLSGVAQQLVRAAYPDAQRILKGSLAKRALPPADIGKVFDAIFGGITDAKTKGAAEAYAPALGLSTPKEPHRLAWIPDGAPAAVADFIAENPSCAVADVYDKFCTEPYGLPSDVVDLLIFACVALGRPHAIEVRPPSGVVLETRDRKGFAGPIRAAQIRQLVWPKGLRGYTIAQSKETAWNDFAPIAQAIDPEQFSLTTDQYEIESQEKTLVLRLKGLGEQVATAQVAVSALAEASGGSAHPDVVNALQRLTGLAQFHTDYSRDAVLAYVREAWLDGNPDLVKDDIQRLNSIGQMVAETPWLAAKLSWFRELVASAPAEMKGDIDIAAPLVNLEQLTSSPGAIAAGSKALTELYAKFMARYRAQHKEYSQWLEQQASELALAAERLDTLRRLNSIAQLGPPDIPSAEADVQRLSGSLTPCPTPEDPQMGNGTSCLTCRFRLGTLDSLEPTGTRARQEVNAAIDRRAKALSQGLIAEALKQSGENDLMALLTAAQANKFKDVIADDLLTDDLVKKINAVLTKAKQQTVPSGRVFGYIDEHPSVTRTNLDSWLAGLRNEILRALESAAKDNPNKEITLLLKAGDD